MWTAYRDKLGYGRFNIKNTPKLAHRIAWANHHGEEIPDGLSVMHLCNNQGCVNPDHLR
nr:HNH endonuclease [Anaerolineae bacterium]